MRLNLIIPGKIKNSSIRDLVEYYSTLCKKYYDFNLTTIKIKEEEKLKLKSIEQFLGKGFNVLLSEKGKEIDTLELASLIEAKKQHVSTINIFLGSAYGFTKKVEDAVDLKLSVSRMTLPHELALVVVLEQLFRCGNINTGGKYHK